MKFSAWVDHKRGDETRTEFLTRFSEECGVSLQTLRFVMRGGRISFYHKARDISDKTEGGVSVQELCE